MFAALGGRRVTQAKLTASGAAAGDQFAVSVVIHGLTAAIGANGRIRATGEAYVFASV